MGIARSCIVYDGMKRPSSRVLSCLRKSHSPNLRCFISRMNMTSQKLPLGNDAYFQEVARWLAEGRLVTVRGQGRSMFPFIVDGRDSVVLGQARQIEVGDIVLANVRGKGYVLHRVYRRQGESLTLMGDGNIQDKEHCDLSAVLGKAVAIIRKGRCIDCDACVERLKAAAWRRLLPLRRYLLYVPRCFPYRR